LTHKETGKEIALEFNFFATCCVEYQDYYFLTGNNNFHVLSPEGKIIYTTERKYEDAIFGYAVRISRVYRNLATIFFSYWAFDKGMNPSGLIKYVLGKGLTSRIEIN
jgi:hypothetical protein